MAAGARKCFNPFRTQLRCFCFMVRRGLGSHSFAFFRLGESRPSSCSKGICSNLRRGMPSQTFVTQMFCCGYDAGTESHVKFPHTVCGNVRFRNSQRHMCCYPHTCRNLLPAVLGSFTTATPLWQQIVGNSQHQLICWRLIPTPVVFAC